MLEDGEEALEFEGVGVFHGAAGGAVDKVETTPVSLRASSSHAADHQRVLAELLAVVSSVGAETHIATRSPGVTVFSEKKVDQRILVGACRAIVEHAMTYDAAYAGKLSCA